jgi:hypothetical protein
MVIGNIIKRLSRTTAFKGQSLRFPMRVKKNAKAIETLRAEQQTAVSNR